MADYRPDPAVNDLQREFGAIDIYLFDQLLRGRVQAGDRIVDVGCGNARNLVYLMRAGFDVYGIDTNEDAIRAARNVAARMAPYLNPENFRVEAIENSTFPDGFAQVVLSSAVLHFAETEQAFRAMLTGSWRILAPGGLFFCRLASSIGIESRLRPRGPDKHRYRLPDGTERYLVDEAELEAYTRNLGGKLLDPLKTTVVQNQRAMTTWVVRKNPGPA